MSQHVAAVIGGTGLVGSHIIQSIGNHAAFPTVSAISRKQLPSFNNLTSVVESDNSKWAASYAALSPTPSVLFSALGTTRGIAGSFEAQRKIDFDLNLEMAKQAKESGSTVYVLISSGGASATSPFPYPKVKGELEEAVSKLGFEHTVILRPGLLLGTRTDSRPPEYAVQLIARGLGKISKPWLSDWWAQSAEEVGKAAVKAGQLCLDGKKEKGVWMVYQKEIVELARSE